MTHTDQTIFTILLWATPSLLVILGFIGALAVQQLVKLSDSVSQIQITIGKIDTAHDNLKERVEKLEEKIFA